MQDRYIYSKSDDFNLVKKFFEGVHKAFSRYLSDTTSKYKTGKTETKSDGSQLIEYLGPNKEVAFVARFTPSKSLSDSEIESIRNKYNLSPDDDILVYKLTIQISKTGEKVDPKFNAYVSSKGNIVNSKDLDKLYDSIFKKINSSVKLQVKLSKIYDSTGYVVSLDKIYSNYSAGLGLDAVDTLLDSEVYNQLFPEQSSDCYIDIVDSGDSFDYETSTVIESEESCVLNSLISLLSNIYSMMINSQYINWNCGGEYLTTVKSISDDILWLSRSSSSDVSTIAKISLGYVPTFDSFYPQIVLLDFKSFSCLDLEAACNYYQETIQELLNGIELYYCNFDTACKSILDSLAVSWRCKLEEIRAFCL